MKKIKRTIWLIFLPFILYSCDGWYSYHYVINNNTSDTLRFYVNNLPPRFFDNMTVNKINKKDSVFIINPRSKLTIEQDGSLCGWAYKPVDLRSISKEERIKNYYDSPLFDFILEVYANNKEIDMKYWNEDCWSFKSKTLLGIYSISITNEMLP